MTGIRWEDDHARFVQDRFPELGGEPIYIRTESELTLNVRFGGARAYTGVGLDLAIRDELTSRNEWRGRGFVCVIGEWAEFVRKLWPEQLGMILHELSHHLAERPAVLDESERAFPGWMAKEAAHCLDVEGELLESAIRFGHGPEFVRAGLHTFWRCRFDVRLCSINLFSDRYGSPDVKKAIAALDVELRTGGSILDVLRTPMPEAFAALWP